jgi:hypothetical protein
VNDASKNVTYGSPVTPVGTDVVRRTTSGAASDPPPPLPPPQAGTTRQTASATITEQRRDADIEISPPEV